MSISVEVSGTLLPRNRAVLDLYKPKLRSFDTSNGDIEHLDVVTTWKGLSINHALEIIFWERATKKALEHHVEEALVAMFFKRVKDHNDLSELEMVQCMQDFVNGLGRQKVAPPLESVINFMREYWESYGNQFQWLVNNREPSVAITNFLRNYEFFDLDVSQGQIDSQGQKDCRHRNDSYHQKDSQDCVIEMYFEAYLAQSERDTQAADESFHSSDNLHITANIISDPYRLDFVLDQNKLWVPSLREPILDSCVGFLPAHVDMHLNGWDGSYASVTVKKQFSDDVHLERVYRLNLPDFIVSQFKCARPLSPLMAKPKVERQPPSKLHVRKRGNTPYSSPNTVKKVKPRRDKQRVEALKLPNPTPLRELSCGSARVQGTGAQSVLEHGPRDVYPGECDACQTAVQYKAHDFDPLQSKFANFDFIRPENTDIIINMVKSTSYGMFGGRPPPSGSPKGMFQSEDVLRNGQLDAVASPKATPTQTPGIANKILDGLLQCDDDDENPFLEQEMSVEVARKVQEWAEANFEARTREHRQTRSRRMNKTDNIEAESSKNAVKEFQILMQRRRGRSDPVFPSKNGENRNDRNSVSRYLPIRSQWSDSPNSDCSSGNARSASRQSSVSPAQESPIHRNSYDDQSDDADMSDIEETMVRIDSGVGSVQSSATPYAVGPSDGEAAVGNWTEFPIPGSIPRTHDGDDPMQAALQDFRSPNYARHGAALRSIAPEENLKSGVYKDWQQRQTANATVASEGVGYRWANFDLASSTSSAADTVMEHPLPSNRKGKEHAQFYYNGGVDTLDVFKSANGNYLRKNKRQGANKRGPWDSLESINYRERLHTAQVRNYEAFLETEQGRIRAYRRESKINKTPVQLAEKEAEAEAEQARIRANYNQFLAEKKARAEGHPDVDQYNVHKSEAEAFESVFMGSPVSLGTVDIDLESIKSDQAPSEGRIWNNAAMTG